jgi:hypothetical protein
METPVYKKAYLYMKFLPHGAFPEMPCLNKFFRYCCMLVF